MPDAREQEAPARARVVSRKCCELAIEILEAKTDAEPLLVLDEETAARLDGFPVERLGDGEARGVDDRGHARRLTRGSSGTTTAPR